MDTWRNINGIGNESQKPLWDRDNKGIDNAVPGNKTTGDSKADNSFGGPLSTGPSLNG